MTRLTCRVCGRKVPSRNWSRICDKCWPEYEKAKRALYQARRRARRELERTYRILNASNPDG